MWSSPVLIPGGGLVNMAEGLCRAAVREFGDSVAVVRPFPARIMLAHESDVLDGLVQPLPAVPAACADRKSVV